MNLIGNINAIPFRRFRGGGGVAPIPPFPSITGMIARYSALGLTNEQMATNPVWADKTGNGHDLQMKNFAWAGMSGVGGYKYNFLSNDWSVDVNQISVALSHKIVVINKRTSIQLLKWIRNELENTINITLKITGLEANGSSFKIYDNVGSSHAQKYNKDGIYEIDYTANEGANKIYFYVIGGNIGQLENPITIEQLPLYPGALVFDGVDDYGVCDNFPILTKEKGYTVVALRQWLTPETKTINEVLLGNFKNNPIWISANLGAFQFEVKYNVSKKVQTDSFGIGNNITLNNNHLFSYQISNSYNGSILRLGRNVGGNFFTVGCSGNQFYANAVIWELVFLDHDATEEELTKIKDYFVKTYPWLFPDQAWTVTGKTNEDEDRATIANITGNGNDLVLSNFAFSGNSGYGEYAYNFNDTSWISIPDYGVISDKTSKSFNIKSFVLADYPVLYTAVNKDSSIKKVKIKVTNSIPGFYFGNKPANQIIDLSTDGIYEIPSYNSPNDVTQYGFRCSNVNDSCNITIEQIPEYEGYLVTDGVDDKITSSTFKMGNDWTVIGDWELINTGKKDNAGIVKFNSIVIYNYNPILINIKNGRNNLIPDQNTVNAICSDGRIYSKDWKESIYNEETESTSKNLLTIGYSGNNYTKIAFRNLAIYPTVLSREDCIKAYNYLQTLKAK